MTNPDTDIHIELHVPDFKKTVEFYNLLGFEIVWINDRYLVMKRGRSYLNFNEGTEKVYEQSYFKKFPRDTKRGYAVEIVIPINNIKEFYESIKDKVNVVQPLIKKRWGKMDCRIEDPFGFYLRFTERFDWINDKEEIKNSKKFMEKLGF
ncbi:MAG: VOC family protein [Candidatus Aenigmatarchaeota archaeon]|nr:VOC family protein [Nanoarchaeota archaeon]